MIDSQKETSYEWNLFIVTAPSSITELFTEERQQGKAYFRAGRIGDISHLTTAGLKPSFASRFCEVYSNMEQRH